MKRLVPELLPDEFMRWLLYAVCCIIIEIDENCRFEFT